MLAGWVEARPVDPILRPAAMSAFAPLSMQEQDVIHDQLLHPRRPSCAAAARRVAADAGDDHAIEQAIQPSPGSAVVSTSPPKVSIRVV
jgi:hypothetical protein